MEKKVMVKHDDNGVSPILAVLLLIAITLMIAGIAAIWVFSFLGEDHEANELYTFWVDLDSSTDTIMITIMKGGISNTSMMKVYIDNDTAVLEPGPIYAGLAKNATTTLDLERGQSYRVKIVIDQNLIFDQKRTAI